MFPKTSGVNGVNSSGAENKALSDESADTVFVAMPNGTDKYGTLNTGEFDSLSGSPSLDTVYKWLMKHSPPLTFAQVQAAIAAFKQ